MQWLVDQLGCINTPPTRLFKPSSPFDQLKKPLGNKEELFLVRNLRVGNHFIIGFISALREASVYLLFLLALDRLSENPCLLILVISIT